MSALIYVIEWQKCGASHADILAICDENNKPRTVEDYDSIVCAEILDKEQFPELYKTVTTLMMHGPCGLSNPNSPCMVDGKCTKQFPEEYVEKTFADADGYPHYQRRNDRKCVVKNGVQLDNIYVVPYNPYSSRKYNAHINVEICSSIQSCKYLYKYVYKGSDMTSVAVQSESTNNGSEKSMDEIHNFVTSRSVTASEAFWRICGFDVHGRDPSIQRLAVHEPNLQMITFSEDNPQEAVSNPKDTTLLAWFKLNQVDPKARHLKYHEILEEHVWNSSQHKWTSRKRCRCIGHMYTTNPSQGEWHYLHVLLHHVAGAMFFNDLLKSPDGTIQTTFKEAAEKLGLLERDDEWGQCLSETAVSFMPRRLHCLFVTLLIFGEPAKPDALWERYKEVMGEDLKRQASHLLSSLHKDCRIALIMKCFSYYRRNWKGWEHVLKSLVYQLQTQEPGSRGYLKLFQKKCLILQLRRTSVRLSVTV